MRLGHAVVRRFVVGFFPCGTGRLRNLRSACFPAMTQQQIWIAAIALIGLDLLFPVIPIMPLVAIYVLIAKPTWFKEFVDYVYRR